MKRSCPSLLLSVLFLNGVALWGQQLVVQADNGKQVVLSRSDIEKLPHVNITIDKSSQAATLEGVPLKNILEKAGIGLGETLKGKRLSSCLVVEAADGYRAIIALPELDPAFTPKQVLLVFLRDGKPLDDKEGPSGSSYPMRKEWLVGSDK
jgi:hypothetical protein